MKRIYMLLLASAMLLPMPVQAYSEDPTADLPDIREGGCIGNYCYTDEVMVDLTLSEQLQLNNLKVKLGNVQLQMARIIANAGARQEQKEALERAKAAEEAAREAAWRKQCSVPLLKIGCPPK